MNGVVDRLHFLCEFLVFVVDEHGGSPFGRQTDAYERHEQKIVDAVNAVGGLDWDWLSRDEEPPRSRA
jgi:hypothetical protein